MTLREELVGRIELLMKDGVGFYSWLEYGDGKGYDFVAVRRWVRAIEEWFRSHLDANSVSVTDSSLCVSWWGDEWYITAWVKLCGWLEELRKVAGTLEERHVELTRAELLEVLTRHM
jgi:hypothetical protein